MADVNYRPATCAWCNADTWCETRANGKPQCRACKVELFFERVLYAPLHFRLLKWQKTDLRALYGTLDPATGLRQYRRAYICKAKKNGKSFLVGGLPIAHLLIEDEWQPKAYGAASSLPQAGIVFQAAADLVAANPDLRAKLRVLPSVKRIVRRDGGGFYQVLSSDGGTSDGIEPSLGIVDELHRWKTERAQTLYDVLTKGMIARPQPLLVEITTAGAEGESLLWESEHDLALQKIEGTIEAKSLYVSIHSADARRVENEPDYWTSREARVQANPSHEDNGGFLKDSAIVEELDKAIADPAKRPAYLRYHLNVKVSSTTENAIDMDRWIQSTEAGGIDLRTWPEYDFELLMRKWRLLEQPAVIGVDASWSIDLSAVSVVFPPGDVPVWRLLLFFFMPAAKVAERTQRDQVPYGAWVQRGFIDASPGNAIDYDRIKQRIRWACEMFDVREVGYDPWNFRATAMDLENEGIPMIEVPQNFGRLSEPTKELLGAYLDGRVWHGNNPVLNFNARCLDLQYDRKNNVQPAKAKGLKSKKRIDGMSATITGMSRGLHIVQSPDLDAFLNDPVRA